MKIAIELDGATVNLVLEANSEADARHHYEALKRQLLGGRIAFDVAAPGGKPIALERDA